MNTNEQLEKFTAAMQTINRYLRYTTFNQEERPITRVQWLLLRHLSRKSNQTIGQLAEHLDVRQSTMSQMLDRLEKTQLVVRQQDEADARIKTVNLTPSGAEIIRRTEHRWIEALAEPFDQFSEEERQSLVELMEKLSQALPKREEKK